MSQRIALPTETKTRRVQLWLRPSLAERMKAAAAANGSSFNALAGALMEDYLRRIGGREGLKQAKKI